MKDFSILERQLNISFKDKKLLTQAFCHRSYLNENPDFTLSNNERLEFLGDAVLELIVTSYLYNNYPDKSEGGLTNWRASLVNSKILGETARHIGFNNFLLLSKGEQKESGKPRSYILGDTFESFIGALFLDQGYEACENFIEKNLLIKLPEIIEKHLFKDPKSKLQEEAQEREKVTPIYEVVKEWGPDHNKHFLVAVFLGKEKIAQAEGSSKQEAEENTAEKALIEKGW